MAEYLAALLPLPLYAYLQCHNDLRNGQYHLVFRQIKSSANACVLAVANCKCVWLYALAFSIVFISEFE